MHKNKYTALLSALTLSLSLAGCAVGVTSTASSKNFTVHKTLNNGQAVTIANLAPSNDWDCQEADHNSYDWSWLQTKGQFTNLGGGYGEIHKVVLQYANDKKLDVNYIYFTVPTEVSVSGWDVNPLMGQGDVKVVYFKCDRTQ